MPQFHVVSRCGIVVLWLLAPLVAAAQTELTLSAAEKLALETAPWLKHHRAAVGAAAERAAYESRLPDPQLVLGAINVPTDSWRLNQEDMTMLMVGVRQSFPAGRTLALRGQRAQEDLARETANNELETRNLLKQVRLNWLELFYLEAALRQISTARGLQERQSAATEGRFRAAQEPPQAVFKARAALARLNERAPMIEAQRARVRAQLGHWIGEAAYAPLPETLPALPDIAGFELARHPEVMAAQAMEAGTRLDTEIARQEYKPGWMLDVGVGFRQNSPTGVERSNMLTATVTVDLPLFRSQRQDRRVAEKNILADGARHEAEDKQRELDMMHRGLHAELEALSARARVFENELLPALRRETEVTSAGFARDQTEYRDAQMRRLDAELEYTRLRVDLLRVHTELLFLTGEKTS